MQLGQPLKKHFFLLPKFVKTPFLIVYLLTLTSALATLVFYFKAQPQIPIFYSLATPSEHLAPKEWLLIFPALTASVTLIHVAVTRSLTQTDRLLITLFSWSTVMIQLILTLALLRIIYMRNKAKVRIS